MSGATKEEMTPDQAQTIAERIAAYEAVAQSLLDGLEDLNPISRTLVLSDARAAFEAAEMLRAIRKEVAEGGAE